MKTRLTGFAAAVALTGAAAILTAPSTAQPPAGTPAAPPPKQQFVGPARITNARVLPAEIGAERLRTTMVGFARSLGVRCTFCHVGQEGAPLETLDFASDANPRDSADWPNGVWTLPPALRHGDVERYRAIGESDRMTLRFVRPR